MSERDLYCWKLISLSFSLNFTTSLFVFSSIFFSRSLSLCLSFSLCLSVDISTCTAEYMEHWIAKFEREILSYYSKQLCLSEIVLLSTSNIFREIYLQLKSILFLSLSSPFSFSFCPLLWIYICLVFFICLFLLLLSVHLSHTYVHYSCISDLLLTYLIVLLSTRNIESPNLRHVTFLERDLFIYLFSLF